MRLSLHHLSVPAVLDDPSLLNHEDHIRVLYCLEALSHCDGGDPL